jgi:hypothetical protein
VAEARISSSRGAKRLGDPFFFLTLKGKHTGLPIQAPVIRHFFRFTFYLAVVLFGCKDCDALLHEYVKNCTLYIMFTL